MVNLANASVRSSATGFLAFDTECLNTNRRRSCANEDIRTAAHSPKGDKAHPRHSVEDERPSNAVRHIPIGWGDERGVTRH